jgi:hypothetical protein
MRKLYGLIFAAVLLCATCAQAFDNHPVNGAAVDMFGQQNVNSGYHLACRPSGVRVDPYRVLIR